MKEFELKSIGPVRSGSVMSSIEAHGFVCLGEKHNVEMTLDEAKKRGIEDKWKDGKIRVDKFAEIISSKMKYELPRAGKRPKVININESVLRCPDCGNSERILLASSDSDIFSHLIKQI